jgi:hypothetical protein
MKSLCLVPIALVVLLSSSLSFADGCKAFNVNRLKEAAKKEVAARYPNFEVGRVFAHPRPYGWSFTVLFKPEFPGGFMHVDYSRCGNLISVEPGK